MSNVTSVKRVGDRLLVELAGTSESSAPYNCRRRGYDSLGAPNVACDQRKIVVARTVTVSFADVPETMKIEPGDRIDFYGKLTQDTQTTVSETAELTKYRAKYAYEGLHLVGAAK